MKLALLQVGKEVIVKDMSSGRNLGTFKTRAEARRWRRQIRKAR